MRHKRYSEPTDLADRIYQMRLEGASWGEIQDALGPTMVTAKDILKRNGFEHSPKGAGRKVTEKWNRPCIRCKKPELRSKGLFLCKSCRHTNKEKYTARDSDYGGYGVSMPTVGTD